MNNYKNRKEYLSNSGSKGNKPQRYSKDSFTKEKIGQDVKIVVVNSQVIQGRLVDLGMFDILVQTSEKRLIILKSSIVLVEVLS